MDLSMSTTYITRISIMLPLAFLKIQDLSLFFDEAKPFVLINETKILTPRLQLHTLGLIFGIQAHHA
jgi:hypothetical protein